MVQGTASGVGKTVLTLALCRIFKEDGLSVAPFKAQNMTANTAFTENGDEIAVSQWLQAAAAGTAPDARMNPVILKPSPCGQGTQVVLGGKSYGAVDAHNFARLKEVLAPQIMDAYTSLREQYDVLVVEGAGSPAELNLSRDDVVNMGMATRGSIPVLLAADIDRGGVFAALYGTVNLLSKPERDHIKAVIVNRFRGDVSLFGEGVEILEKITGLPVAGVIPFIGINLPEEDDLPGLGAQPCVPGPRIEEEFDRIAQTVRGALNMELIYKILDDGV